MTASKTTIIAPQITDWNLTPSTIQSPWPRWRNPMSTAQSRLESLLAMSLYRARNEENKR